jgi:hypothetical protein
MLKYIRPPFNVPHLTFNLTDTKLLIVTLIPSLFTNFNPLHAGEVATAFISCLSSNLTYKMIIRTQEITTDKY